MFKKMKNRITDEMNSATSKLQNMQIIDQLASSIGQQLINDATPNLLLPEPQISSTFDLITNNTSQSDQLLGQCEEQEEEELNSQISPQHQLFDENSIKRLEKVDNLVDSSATHHSSGDDKMDSILVKISSDDTSQNNEQTVINVEDLNSDLEDEFRLSELRLDEDDDQEIDLLTDRSITDAMIASKQLSDSHVNFYKSKYRQVVHKIRRIDQQMSEERNKFQLEKQELINQHNVTKSELDAVRIQLNNTVQQSDSLISGSTMSEYDRTSIGSSQPPTEATNKDLEILLSKYKESLKLKNSHISKLKDSLVGVQGIRKIIQDMKQELNQLRGEHETWTVSIAEEKRTTHMEIESKNIEINLLKSEISDNNKKLRQLKSAIQDLESRIVNTSAAHMKERESLTKELTVSKNNAIRQIQKEHELNIERVKLDLEKTIEALKVDILNKDKQLIKLTEQFQHSQGVNKKLNEELETLQAENQTWQVERQKHLNDIEVSQEKISSLESKLAAEIVAREKQAQVDSRAAEESDRAELMNKISAQEEELKRVKDILGEKEKLHKDRIAELDGQHNNVVEEFQQRIEDMDERLHQLESICQDKDCQLTSLKDELAHIRQNGSNRGNCNQNPIEVVDVRELEKLRNKQESIEQLEEEKNRLKDKIDELESKLDDRSAQSIDNSVDHTYQIRALQRVLKQYQ